MNGTIARYDGSIMRTPCTDGGVVNWATGELDCVPVSVSFHEYRRTSVGFSCGAVEVRGTVWLHVKERASSGKVLRLLMAYLLEAGMLSKKGGDR